MNAREFLVAAEALPYVHLKDLVGSGGIVIVAPHPDDESLGCAGLIAMAVAADISVRLIIVSDGVGSHRNSKTYPPAKLRAVREKETLDAAVVLGLQAKHVDFLGLPDAAIPTTGAAAEKAVSFIVSAAQACDASALLVTWRHDPHCDHTAAAVLAELALEKIGHVRALAYPIWGWNLSADIDVGGPPIGGRLDISNYMAVKAAAIASHQSQTTALIDDDPDGFRLDEAMLERFARPFEIFLRLTA